MSISYEAIFMSRVKDMASTKFHWFSCILIIDEDDVTVYRVA